MHPEPSIFDYKNKCENKKIYASSLFTNFLFSLFSSLLIGCVSTQVIAQIFGTSAMLAVQAPFNLVKDTYNLNKNY